MLLVLIIEQGLLRLSGKVLGAGVHSTLIFLKKHITVESVEQASKTAAKHGSHNVVRHIVDQIASVIIQVSDAVEAKCHRNSWVVARTKFASSLNHTEKRQSNTESARNTITSDLDMGVHVLDLDHEDHAHENEGADDFVHEDLPVKIETFDAFPVVAVRLTTNHWVLLRTEPRHERGRYSGRLEGLSLIKRQVGESHSETTTKELPDYDQEQEAEILSILALRNVDSKRDSWVKVASCDRSKDHD